MKSDDNFWRVVIFVMGVLVGAFITIGMQQPNITRAQMIRNDCPRIVDGEQWCEGPGAPR